jgi:DNA polymerase
VSKIKNCKRCPLHLNRIQTVFGNVPLLTNRKDNGLLVVGEAPGYMEDISGEPFVGKSGKLLTEKLNDFGFKREQTNILNTIKCNPPDNRDPKQEELFWCNDYLLEQIETIDPVAILTVGKIATWTVLVEKDLDFENPSIRRMGTLSQYFNKIHKIKIKEKEYPLIVSYHPAYWLRNISAVEKYVNPQLEILRGIFSGKNY